SEGDVLDALQAQRIPPEAQALSGVPLVEYLRKNQKLFEVEPNPATHYYKKMLMDLEFIDPIRHNYAARRESGLYIQKVSMVEFNGPIARHSLTSVINHFVVSRFWMNVTACI
ncbi:hypothetical protein OSTOST_17046, partial [Ostertagia ostertagi]